LGKKNKLPLYSMELLQNALFNGVMRIALSYKEMPCLSGENLSTIISI